MWRIEDERQGGAGETSDRQRKQQKKTKKKEEKKNAQERESVKDQECEESQKK